MADFPYLDIPIAQPSLQAETRTAVDEDFVDQIFFSENDPSATTLRFVMRGFDTTLARIVYWKASFVDTGATQYTGPGPVTQIVISDILGSN